eukprot:COSAG05_NODE_16566_length_343_cov_0.639344_1_plen_32_part_01
MKKAETKGSSATGIVSLVIAVSFPLHTSRAVH